MDIATDILLRAIDTPFHSIFRRTGKPVVVPVELSFAVTYRCLNQCLTCHCSDSPPLREVTGDEYDTLFKSISFNPLAVTFTGGEPFVRDDFPHIVKSACSHLDPRFVFIQSCGDHPDNIFNSVKDIAAANPESLFIIVLSLDGTYTFLDRMRGGITHSFESLLKTYQSLRVLGHPNLIAGFNILITKHNATWAHRFIDDAFLLYPDFIGIDFAFGSETLGVTAVDVAPDAGFIEPILEHYLKKIGGLKPRGPVRLINRILSLRAQTAAANLLNMKNTTKCHAGFSYLYIDPAGSVRDCPVAAREMGDLRENGFDLNRILESHQAHTIRKLVAESGCFCTMSAPALSNLMLSPADYLRLAAASF